MTVYAALGGEAAVGFDDQVVGNAGLSLQTVNVLCEDLGEQALFGEEGDEDVGESGLVVARV